MKRRPFTALMLALPVALIAFSTLGSAVVVSVPVAAAAYPLIGSQGTDTRLPLTDSAITVNGRGTFSSLEITINQTEQLTNQARSGRSGEPSARASTRSRGRRKRPAARAWRIA